MDPNETLKRLRRWAASAINGNPILEADDAAELFQALDEWILKGGFLPSDWKPKDDPFKDLNEVDEGFIRDMIERLSRDSGNDHV